MLHAVIMAGGSGTRFWPASRNDRPKQLLDLVGGRTMIQATVDRLTGLIAPENVLIVTNRSQAASIAAQLPELPADSILGEPCKRDTAPCIGLAAFHVRRADPDAALVVMPADHVIDPPDRFQAAIRLAAQYVDQSPARIVTFGIRPTYPAESFGYIERGAPLPAPDAAAIDAPAYRVERFREKPHAEVARQYVESGQFYWNSGIFVWKASTILDALAQHQPQMHRHLTEIAAAAGTADYPAVLEREFAAIHGVSIDYAVMEHARDIVVIEAPFAWDDVGSWHALARLRGTDAEGNTLVGKHLGIETEGTIVRTDGAHLVVTVGLKDCIVVHTPDATLVADKNAEEMLRGIVRALEERGWQEYL